MKLSRPITLNEYIGQEKTKKSIRVSLEASKKRDDAFPHVLLHGGSGLGKTTLAYTIANEFGSKCKTFLAPTIKSPEVLEVALLKCTKGDMIFIDEVHALPKKTQESLYTAMEDGVIHYDNGDVDSIKLEPFTCITATTDLGKLTTPFRERFGFIFPLNPYSYNEIESIIKINVKKLNLRITKKALNMLGRCSRKNPRTANRLIERCYDTATIKDTKSISKEVVDETMDHLQIDENGLTTYDLLILEALCIKFEGNPVGLKNLSLVVNIDQSAIETIYEPWLLELNLIDRTPRGRMITKQGLVYFAENDSKNS